MPNMSYCMFENTYSDLRDAYERISGFDFDPKELSESEQNYLESLKKLCRDIADEFSE